MQNFTDEKGGVWGIEINRPMLRKVKGDTGVLLTDLLLDDSALLKQICCDPLLAGSLLWSVCEEQATRRGIGAGEFEKLTDGDCFEGAVKQLIEAIIDFFPPARRDQIRSMMKMSDELMNQVIHAGLERMDEEIKELIRSSCTTSAAESSELTESTNP